MVSDDGKLNSKGAKVMPTFATILTLFLVLLAPALRAQPLPAPNSTFIEMPAITPLTAGSCGAPYTYVTCSDLSGQASFMVDGYYSPGDGGGGYFVRKGVGCTATTKANGGSILYDGGADMIQACFYRTSPPTDVRQWGAHCDVQSFAPGGVWDAMSKWIVIQTPSLPGLLVNMPLTNEFITVTQIGPGGDNTGASTTPPVWADRWSTLGNHGGSPPTGGYHVGDLIAFKASATSPAPIVPGTFSQQVSIVVDQLGVGAADPKLNMGPIFKWHFVSGGQYTGLPSVDSNNSMQIDFDHSCLGVAMGVCATSGDMTATFVPAWSGWSVMDAKTTLAPLHTGNVSPGDIITFDVATGAGTVNQNQYPKIVVMSVSGGVSPGPLASWQWLNYGSYSAIPSSVTTDLVQTGSCGGSCIHLTPEWTRGALATTIAEVYEHGHGTNACPASSPIPTFCIMPTDAPLGVPDQQPIEGFYYGHDDGQSIQSAITNSGAAQSIHVTGHCGTTIPIVLPTNPGVVTPGNTTLVGDSYKSAGIFAFAWDLASRALNPTSEALMNHVIYGPAGKLAFGGGIRDLEIEGMGVPQGFGYYNPAVYPPVKPDGYNGPVLDGVMLPCTPTPKPPSTPTSTVCTPSSGSVVEIDDAKEAILNNLAVFDAYGEGNAEFQAGENDADPTTSLGSDFGSIFLNSDRFALTSNQQGALDPEFAINFQAVHDSQYSNLVASDATEANVFEGKGNLYNGLHVGSQAVAAQHGTGAPQPIPWTPTGTPPVVAPLAGAAFYGLESPKNVFLSNMQCDNAWLACVFIGSAFPTPSDAPSVVTNIAQRCVGLANVWPNYYGVELAAAIQGVAVNNVDANPNCGIANSQLVYYDQPLDGALAASQNLAAQYCMPARGFQPGRYYTTPFTSTAPAPITMNTLYAIPVLIACTVTVTELSTYVTTPAGASCEYGIYGDNGAGQPGALILDAGSVTLGSGAAPSLVLSQRLSPGLVFLAVDCSGGPTLEGGSVTGNLMGDLVGLGAQVDKNVVMSAAWSYGALPHPFPSVIYAPSSTVAPLVFLKPG